MRLKSMAVAIVPAAFLLAASSAVAAPMTLGALFQFNGLLGATPVSGSIYDGAIHSGVFGLSVIEVFLFKKTTAARW